METSRHPKTELLPTVSPDLAVTESAGGEWTVLQISPQLAKLAGVTPDQGRGRLLEGLFPRTQPALAELATEVLTGDAPLAGIHVRLVPGGTTLSADIGPGGMTPDYRPVVLFAFRQVPVAAAGDAGPVHGLIGASPAMSEVVRKISIYGLSPAPVVVTGETGTGKELVARALHEESDRRRGPFVAVNCSAISEELLESELFGHEKGAFTGAHRTHQGRFERADGGTLFLDEIGDMPTRTQAKLLRVLEEGVVERVGGEREQPVDVRVVAATHVPMERAVGAGRFRADLYHRLSVLRIHLPPLRERLEDLPALVDHFLASCNRRYGRQVHRLTSEALELLCSYLWPGNVRELRNVLERVFVESRGEVIGARAFAEWVRERQDFTPAGWDLETARDAVSAPLVPPYPLPAKYPLLPSPARPPLEADLASEAGSPKRSTLPANLGAEEIRRAFRSAGGNLSAAARLLGVHRATLYRYLAKLGLTREELDR